MTTEAAIGLKKADAVEITTVMDNYVDVFLDKSSVVARPPLAIDGDIPVDDLVAEHGLSLLITVKSGQDSHSILFDCGHTRIGVPNNLRILGIDLQQIEAIVLNIDVEKQKFSLGIKQLEGDIWEDFFSRHKIGDLEIVQNV